VFLLAIEFKFILGGTDLICILIRSGIFVYLYNYGECIILMLWRPLIIMQYRSFWIKCCAFVAWSAFLYIVVQSAGAMAGAGILKLLSNIKDDQLCTSKPGEGVTLGQIFGYEILISFVLVITVFATCDSLRSGFGGSGPLAIGLSVSMCHLWAVRIILFLHFYT